MNKDEKTKMNWRYSIWMVVMLIPIIWAYINLENYCGTRLSIQLIAILLGTMIMMAFLVVRIFDWPKIHNMKLETAKIYFSTTVNVILAAFAISGIAFTILWGNLYTYAIENKTRYYIERLDEQGFVLLLLVTISSIIVLATFLHPLIRRINEKGNC